MEILRAKKFRPLSGITPYLGISYDDTTSLKTHVEKLVYHGIECSLCGYTCEIWADMMDHHYQVHDWPLDFQQIVENVLMLYYNSYIAANGTRYQDFEDAYYGR
jgi:hypothetical protein